MVLVKILVFLLTLVIGIVIIRFTDRIVNIVGKSQWAEQKLGMGGSYSLWKLFALLLIVWGFLYMIGIFDIAPRSESLNL